MNKRPRILLDTSVVKLAATRVIRGFRRQATVRSGEHSLTLPVTQFRYVQHLPKPWSRLSLDLHVLQLIADAAKRERIELLWHWDAWIEFGGLPNTDCPDGTFFGAPMTWVHHPATGGRILLGGSKSTDERQLEFLLGFTEPRYLALRKAIGADRSSKRFQNQLMDAFHLWMAESTGATHLLTVDYKLIRRLRGYRPIQPRVSVVRPFDLIKELNRNACVTSRDVWRLMWRKVTVYFSPPPARSGLEDLARMGEALERRGYYDA